MTAQEYLEQAYSLDRSINSKLAQVTALNELAQRSSAVLTGIPRSPNRATSIMTDAIDNVAVPGGDAGFPDRDAWPAF